MKYCFVPLLLLAMVLALPTSPYAAEPLERLAAASTELQAGLQSYQVDLSTSKLGEILERMTAGMPADMPRPEVPTLRKYWKRGAPQALIRAEGATSFPYMQEMVERFSREFAVELRSYFLPPAKGGERADLIATAERKIFESQLEENRTLTVQFAFAEPVDLGGAFYGDGLSLPQQGVTELQFDLDPDRQILRHLEIVTVDNRRLLVEVRHREVQGGHLPEEIHITTPDGSVDDRFITEFGQFEGYWLPAKQVRTIRRPGREEVITVTFSEYRINATLPEPVLRALGD